MGSEALEIKTCGQCIHYVEYGGRCDKTLAICYKGSTACKKFIRNYKSCGNCIHFLDGGEPNLCCDIKPEIYKEYEEACKDYEPI